MPSVIKMDVEGLDTVEDMLGLIGDHKLAVRAVSNASAWALKIVLKEAQQLVPKVTHSLEDSIMMRKKQYFDNGASWVGIGIVKGVERPYPPGQSSKKRTHTIPRKYAHLVEKTDPFMGPAIENNKDKVVKRWMQKLDKEIDKQIKKAKAMGK